MLLLGNVFVYMRFKPTVLDEITRDAWVRLRVRPLSFSYWLKAQAKF